MRLIDADALLVVPNVNKVTEYDEAGFGMSYNAVSVETIEAVPTVDAKPVRHGRWVKINPMFKGLYQCSECGTYVGMSNGALADGRKDYYCPNCGARMDGDEHAAD